MKPTPFDPSTDLAPLPFTDKLLELARELKTHGLEWRPHVGCFVWDPDGRIDAPSPFPKRVYFILNLGRFESIMGSVDAVRDDLIWLPTADQARAVIARLGGEPTVSVTSTLELYRSIRSLLP